MTTNAQHSDLQKFLTNYPHVATRSEITAAVDGIISLQEAQQHIHALFWKYHQNLKLLWIYGEFLYLSGYDTHPEHLVDSLIIRTCNETTWAVKRLAFEQWQARHPEGYPGYVWLHYPSKREQQTIRQVWQVSVYHRFRYAVTHDISIRLSVYDNGTWDLSQSHWYRKHVPFIDYSTSMIAEYPDGQLKVIDNITFDWNKEVLPMRHCPVRPHVPAYIIEQMHASPRIRKVTPMFCAGMDVRNS